MQSHFPQIPFSLIIQSDSPTCGNLLLGDIDSALQKIVVQTNCQAVVTVARDSGIKYPSELKINHLVLDLEDTPKAQLYLFFDDVADFMHSNLNSTNVLIHCFRGVSRSASFVIAYLIKYKKMKLDEAYSLVKQKRPQIAPNEGFIGQLRCYEERVWKDDDC